jgi:hypothetical protein
MENHIYMCLYRKKSSPEPAGQTQSNFVQILLGEENKKLFKN